MKSLATIALCLLSTVVWAVGLNFGSTTNNSTIAWSPWTNGIAIRYTCFYTPLTNSDVGTNWQTTTNWLMFADVQPGITSASMAQVPTNVYVTMNISIPSGKKTLPSLSNGVPYRYVGYPGLILTNQPAAP